MTHTCTQRQFSDMASALYDDGNTGWILKTRYDALQQKTSWLEGVAKLTRSPLDSDAWITYYIVYDTLYSQPQLCFSMSVAMDAPALSACFPKLHFLHHASEDSKRKLAPLVSYCMCEEIAQGAWRVHSCDTCKLLACAAMDGCKGNLLELFVTAISSYFDFPAALCVQ